MFLLKNVLLWILWLSEREASISLYGINWSVFYNRGREFTGQYELNLYA
jgi:hypothetical protein